MSGRVAKIPIDNAFIESVATDFVDSGEYDTFLHIYDTFSRFSVSVFSGDGGRRTNIGNGRETAISNWIAVFGEPDIPTVDKYMGSIGEIFQDFCSSRNIVLQTAIPGLRQSLGSEGRRHGHVRAIADHIFGNWKEIA